MSRVLDELTIDYVQFLNLFPQRAPRLMWFLGAGASVSSGLPTAGTLIWDCKRRIYCSENRVPPSRFPDLEHPSFRAEVQSYFDSQPGTPKLGMNEEYSYYFNRYLPDEGDRHRYLRDKLHGTQPSYGHICLAALMATAKTRIIWTTNFDSLVERAYQTLQTKQASLPELNPIDLANTEVLTHCVANESWPILVKLHGDYKYKKLMNTTEELKSQDRTLRRELVNLCRLWGLVVVGYSGRDDSVMEALTDAAQTSPCYPQGLYWFVRSGSKPEAPVIELVETVRAAGAQAAVIEVGGFDELMEDVFLPHQDQMPIARDLVKASRPRRRAVESNYGKAAGWPLVRTNALEVTDYPATCTIFECKIGGAKEVNEAIDGHRDRLTASRRKQGVIAFGTKRDILRSFEGKEPSRFDVHPIEPRRFRYESQELGMFYDALCQGVTNATGLWRVPGKKGRILYFPATFEISREARDFLSLSDGFRPVSQPKKPGPFFHQAVSIALDYRDGRLWCVLEPTVVLTADGKAILQGTGKASLIKEHLSSRYNSQSNHWLDFWVKFLSYHRGKPIRITFPDDENPEAEFKLSATTAYSRPE